MFKSLMKKINYWSFRYLVVTELYMVEKWERVVVHVLFFLLFTLLSLFNNRIVVSFVSWITSPLFVENIKNDISPSPVVAMSSPGM